MSECINECWRCLEKVFCIEYCDFLTTCAFHHLYCRSCEQWIDLFIKCRSATVVLRWLGIIYNRKATQQRPTTLRWTSMYKEDWKCCNTIQNLIRIDCFRAVWLLASNQFCAFSIPPYAHCTASDSEQRYSLTCQCAASTCFASTRASDRHWPTR